MNKPNPEVNANKQRKKFTVKYKLEMLKKVEECEDGDIGSLLRKEVVERRRQKASNSYKKPELLATQTNEIWSWDITKLKGPEKWTYFYLYVVLDIFSRYAVGWMVATRESGELAKQLMEETCEKQKISEGSLTIHSDRGSAMKSKTVAQLYSDLGVVKSLSRPSVSNDNPYSESQFKTLKYCPAFPENFGCLADAKAFCREFFDYYNNEHYHTGISLLTPAMVHYKEADDIIQKRQTVLSDAYSKNPQRFVMKHPEPKPLHKAVWINKPSDDKESELISAYQKEIPV